MGEGGLVFFLCFLGIDRLSSCFLTTNDPFLFGSYGVWGEFNG